MFTLYWPTGGFSAFVGVRPSSFANSGFTIVPGFPSYYSNPILEILDDAVMGPFPEVVAFDDEDGSYEFMNFVRYQPIKSVGPYSPLADSIRFGGGLYTFFNVLPKDAKRLVRESLEEGEYSVTSLIGDATFMGNSVSMDSTRFEHQAAYGYKFRGLPLDLFHQFHVRSAFRFNSDSTISYSYVDVDANSLLIERLDDLRSALEEGDVKIQRAYALWIIYTRIVSLEYETLFAGHDGAHIKIKCVAEFGNSSILGGPFSTIKKEYVLDYHFQALSRPLSEYDDVYNQITCISTLTGTEKYFDYDGSERSTPSWAILDGQVADIFETDFPPALLLSEIGPVNLDQLPVVKQRIVDLIDKSVAFAKDHEMTFNSHAFYSSADAVVKFGAGSDMNLLEAFTEMSSWLDLPSVDKIKTLFRFDFRSLNWYRLSVSLVDVLTDIKLWYSFGARPNADIVLSMVDGLIKEFQGEQAPDLLGWKTLYGRANIDIAVSDLHGQELYESIALESRSKIRVRFDPTSYAVAALSLRQAGIFPGLANLWDCGRWTFVIDWFIRLGEKLQAVDNQLILVALPCGVNTHSHRVSCKPKIGDLRDLGLTVSHCDVFIFRRYASCLLPSLRNAEVDFTPPTELDWATVGSFLWKTLGAFLA